MYAMDSTPDRRPTARSANSVVAAQRRGGVPALRDLAAAATRAPYWTVDRWAGGTDALRRRMFVAGSDAETSRATRNVARNTEEALRDPSKVTAWASHYTTEADEPRQQRSRDLYGLYALLAYAPQGATAAADDVDLFWRSLVHQVWEKVQADVLQQSRMRALLHDLESPEPPVDVTVPAADLADLRLAQQVADKVIALFSGGAANRTPEIIGWDADRYKEVNDRLERARQLTEPPEEDPSREASPIGPVMYEMMVSVECAARAAAGRCGERATAAFIELACMLPPGYAVALGVLGDVDHVLAMFRREGGSWRGTGPWIVCDPWTLSPGSQACVERDHCGFDDAPDSPGGLHVGFKVSTSALSRDALRVAREHASQTAVARQEQRTDTHAPRPWSDYMCVADRHPLADTTYDGYVLRTTGTPVRYVAVPSLWQKLWSGLSSR